MLAVTPYPTYINAFNSVYKCIDKYPDTRSRQTGRASRHVVGPRQSGLSLPLATSCPS